MSSKTTKAAATAAPKPAKKASKGKRYSLAEKQKVIEFVNEVNASKGRGGQSAASKKFGISPLTISSWLKSGGAAPKKPGRKPGRKPGPKPGPKPAETVAVAAGGSLEEKLDQLKSLAKEIDSTQKQLGDLQKKFDGLKASL